MEGTKKSSRTTKRRKKYIRRRIFLSIIIIFSISIFTYFPLKVKANIEIKNEQLEKEKVKREELTNKYNFIKDNIDESFYEDEKELNDIIEFINEIDSKLENLENNHLIDKFEKVYTQFKDILDYDINYLEEEYSKILDINLEYYTEEEIEKLKVLKNDYSENFSNEKYKSAKNSLEELKVYTDDINKLANERRLDYLYDKNYNESSSYREPKIVDGILLVNKEFGLSENYAPEESQEAREAFEKMKIDAEQEDIYIEVFSTYRSYYNQYNLYYNYVYNYGQEAADTFSARPGFSEHQTGLAFDIGGLDRTLWAEQGFKDTVEAKWLKENAWKYGFILRYPKGKEWKTGYMYESWHYRYIGIEHSVNFKDNDLTLEEYLGY